MMAVASMKGVVMGRQWRRRGPRWTGSHARRRPFHCFRWREREKEREGGRLTAVVEPSTALMAGDIVVIEADPWDPSDVSVEMLQSLIDDGLLRPITDPDRPEWIAPLGEPEPRPPTGYVVSFVSFHERGLGVPVDRFMQALPHYYGVELHNINPNSIV